MGVSPGDRSGPGAEPVTATLTPHFVVTDDEIAGHRVSRWESRRCPSSWGAAAARHRDGPHRGGRPRHPRADRARADPRRRGRSRTRGAAARRCNDRTESSRCAWSPPTASARVAVVRQGAQCISARRVGNEIVLEAVEGLATLVAASPRAAAPATRVFRRGHPRGRRATRCGQLKRCRAPTMRRCCPTASERSVQSRAPRCCSARHSRHGRLSPRSSTTPWIATGAGSRAVPPPLACSTPSVGASSAHQAPPQAASCGPLSKRVPTTPSNRPSANSSSFPRERWEEF